MTRTEFLRRFTAVGAAPFIATFAGTSLVAAACKSPAGAAASGDSVGTAAAAAVTGRGTIADVPVADPAIQPLVKTDAEWRRILPEDAYQVLRHEATERPGSSPLDDEKRAGTFVCAGCYLPLFESAAKFDSGTGWPSFFRPIAGNIDNKVDRALSFEVRTEYHCTRCRGHHGHVFEDGPRPTGLRYCNNGVALRFVPRGEAMPALRT